jgi:hypothetical protein
VNGETDNEIHAGSPADGEKTMTQNLANCFAHWCFLHVEKQWGGMQSQKVFRTQRKAITK